MRWLMAALIALAVLMSETETVRAGIVLVNDGFEAGDTSGWSTPGHGDFAYNVLPTGDAAGKYTLALTASGRDGMIEVKQTWEQDVDAILKYYIRGSGYVEGRGRTSVWFDLINADTWEVISCCRRHVLNEEGHAAFSLDDNGDFVIRTVRLEAGKSYTAEWGARTWDLYRPDPSLFVRATSKLQGDLEVTAVPAPSSLTCMAGLFAMGLVASWWRRWKATS